MRTILLLTILVGLVWVDAAQAAVQTKAVEYTQGGATLEGYLAYDGAMAGKRPGVLVVHEWWGVNDYIKGRARQLARNAQAGQRSWAEMYMFFGELFGPGEG